MRPDATESEMLQFSSFQGKSVVIAEQIGMEEAKQSQWKEGATCIFASTCYVGASVHGFCGYEIVK